MSDNDQLSISIGAKTDKASFQEAAEAARAVGGAFAKTFEQVERSKSLDGAAKAFAKMAVAQDGAAKAAIGLIENLKEMGATDKEIDKTVAAFERQIDAVQKADRAAAEKAANDAQRASARLEQDEAAARKENERRDNDSRSQTKLERFENVESTSGKIGDVGDSLAALGSSTGIGALGDLGALFEGAEALARLKAGAEALPESINATAQALGLAKSAQEATTVVTGAATAAEGTQAAVTGTLAAASGGASVGLGAMLVALGPIAAIGLAVAAGVVLVGAALGELNKQSQAAADALGRRFDAQDKVDELVRSGATRDEALARRAELEEEVADATRRSNEAQAEKAATFAADAAATSDVAARLRGNNAVYKEFDERIKETGDSAKDAEAELKELNKQLEDGSFAANDAAAKAEEAGKAQEKAAEDTTRAQEKAAADAERVAEKRASDEKAAAEKAQREAEQAAEKIRAAQESIAKTQQNFANKQVDMARQAGEKLADIRQSGLDKAQDTDLKYYRDTVKIANDARANDLKAREEDAQAELNATRDTNRKLEDLRDNALASEEESLNSRNFLAAAKASEGLEKANKQAIKEANRATDDRAAINQQEEKDRAAELKKARDERLEALKTERDDNKTAQDRAVRDARTAKERQFNEAEIAYNRELQAQQAYLASLGVANAAFYAQQTSLAQSAASGGSTQAGLAASTGGGSLPLNTSGASGSFGGGSFGGLRPITTAPALRNATTNHISIQANTSQDVYDALEKAGVINA